MQAKVIKFTVPGQPIGKARQRTGALLKCKRCHKKTMARFCKSCGGHDMEFLAATNYTPKGTQMFENRIAVAAQEAMVKAGNVGLLSGPLKLEVRAYFAIPPSRAKKLRVGDKHAQKPDGDNVLKAVCDGINKVLIVDDALISDVCIHKFWGEIPRTEVQIEELEAA